MSSYLVLKTTTKLGFVLGSIIVSGTASQATASRSSQIFASRAAQVQLKSNLPEFGSVLVEAASSDVRFAVRWILNTGDNGALPFVIVDKKNAKVYVFNGKGDAIGAAAALLGMARGDYSAPGVGNRKLSEIPLNERTTAAGRFVADLGRNLTKRDVLWVDYSAGLALHRVVPRNLNVSRTKSIATRSPANTRVTYGCVEVSDQFYDSIVRPAFLNTSGIVYILPEIKAFSEFFKHGDKRI